MLIRGIGVNDYSQFFLMDTESAKKYAVDILKYFSPDEPTECIEIGDGNINYVFKVYSLIDGHSVIIKQADKFLRSSGRPLDTYRNKIEAMILQLEGQLAPGYVPEVYFYDEIMAATSMEDVSAYFNLRKELAQNHVYPHLAENISSFLANTLLPTTDLVLASDEKKNNVKFYINPELCDITEDLVLSEPYLEIPYRERNKNIISDGNEAFVQQMLYEDDELHYHVAILRNHFMNCAQALIHGDLHSGSIFTNENGIKVLDPEFAFYGPMGYDIGNVIGNFFFSLANKIFTMPEEIEAVSNLESTICDIFNLTAEKLSNKYDELVSFKLYKNEQFKHEYISKIMSDSVGYAGTEIIRRTVGDSKVKEISSVTDMSKRIPLERALVELGILFVKSRSTFTEGAQLCEAFRQITKRYL